MDTVEKVARALFNANPNRNKALRWEHAACPRKRYLAQARAAISAHESALKENGLVIVPREPTEEMLAVHWEFFAINMPWNSKDNRLSHWRAMVDAAPHPARPKAP